jgi:hypothetical protein
MEDRHHLVEPRAGDDEAADVLGEMAGKADDLAGEFQNLADPAIGGIEPGAPRIGRVDAIVRPAPDVAGERPTVSSESPNALPTSRAAERDR